MTEIEAAVEAERQFWISLIVEDCPEYECPDGEDCQHEFMEDCVIALEEMRRSRHP